MMDRCTNPNCRHRNKRKLRPLVISLLPPTTTQNNDSSLSSTNATATRSNSNNTINKITRQEQIMHMFASHPSLSAHFEPPTFSPGVPSRDLRNQLKFLEHCHNAGIIPDVEWEGICRAVREQQPPPPTKTSTEAREDSAKNDDGDAASHDQEESVVCSEQSVSVESKREIGVISMAINPFRYLAVETLIPSKTNDDNDGNNDNNKSASKNKTKKKQWLQYETTSLIPISPHRRGSAEDIILPYSMEIWRKAKTLNRDRSVLACTLAHLRAMKTLVSSRENENDDSPLDDGNSSSSSTAEFDFILEDNIRAFLGIADDGAHPEEVVDMLSDGYSGWSCECANRIWDIIEASNASQSKCHMRYYGWLSSLANLAWIYGNHIPRSALNDAAILQHDVAGGCVIFPYPTNEDFELDSITASSKSTKDVAEPHNPSCNDQASSPVEACSTPQFNTPGGTAAVWGTFAYTVSPAAYHSFILRLQNDVGSLMWKGKKMRAYRAKPIDKILPRHVKSEYEPSAVHVPSKVAFVRGPMVSLLHPQWDAGFRSSTELQYRLSYGCKDNSCIDVWSHVWLGRGERDLVQHKKDGEQSGHEEQNQATKEESSHRLSDRMSVKTALSFSLLAKVMLLIVVAYSDAFSFDTPVHNGIKLSTMLTASMDVNGIDSERKRGKIGKVPIISRTIPVDVDLPSDLAGNDRTHEHIYSLGKDMHRLDVTIWEMHQPSELIQEWWSIDKSEQDRRVGDPFGVVMWPGSILASKELMKQHLCSHHNSSLTNSTVLVLGAGTGVEALTAALLGAKRVIATDINPLTLKLLEYGANDDVRISDNFIGEYFDLFSDKALPECDILVAADVLYNSELAKQVGLRLYEAVVRSFNDGAAPLKVIITDSQQFHGTNFLHEVAELRELNSLFNENNFEQLEWKSFKLENVCGSGVLVDEDQIYDVDVRMISWGWQIRGSTKERYVTNKQSNS